MNETNDLLTEVQELVWALLDDQATERDINRLEQLLLDNDDARRAYATCVQMHNDLHSLLGGGEPTIDAIRGNAPKRPSPLPLVDLPVGGVNSPMVSGFPS
jgi:hypothetical protein